jgi:KUP system potassium uptake protein
MSSATQKTLPLPQLSLAALGVVYGDLGTSPLYTMHAISASLGGPLTPAIALGALSLIFWTLIITISIKYCIFVMRADNHGEGGTLALMAVVGANRFRKRRWALTAMGLLGAALLYGDGAITPAISVLSALEGLNIATSSIRPFIVPAAMCILFALFFVQQYGTRFIGLALGPVMLMWFAVIAVLGVMGIARHPSVLAAISPIYVVRFFAVTGWRGFLALGGVFLCVTGGEALYADIGHFGRRPIRIAWYGLVLPSLVINYAGQTGNLLANPAAHDHPFFQLGPSWSIYPLVVLATLATVIASQAIITGAFSLSRQAMHLGWLPGMTIRQTSEVRYGQIYVPIVNWLMMAATMLLVLSFGSSARLAGAYGTAVSTTMVLTSLMLIDAMYRVWKWPILWIVVAGMLFMTVDLVFFAANLAKIFDGGWIPLLFGTLIFIVMTTWRRGTDSLHRRQFGQEDEAFLAKLHSGHIPRVPGTAVFLTRHRRGVPSLMVEHVKHMGALHSTAIELTVKLVARPYVEGRRCSARCVGSNIWRATVRFGFNEDPDLLGALEQSEEFEPKVNFRKVIYFAARDVVIHDTKHPRLARWQLALFQLLFRNSAKLVDRFNLPRENFVEIARQITV